MDEKVEQIIEFEKLKNFLIHEAKVNFANIKELGNPEFRLVVREDGTAYAHVMNRHSTTCDFCIYDLK